MPAITGFDIAGWNQQAEATGGDFFEFQEVSKGCLAVTVADVCGRGAGAAAVADECRIALHEAFEVTEEPARVAERVNRRLFAGRPPERFVTAFFGLLDHNEHRLSYISAGHGPTWFYSRELNSLRELEVHGYPLALMLEESFDEGDLVVFAPGDFVAIVTDGFFEWADSHGECFGTQRLCAQILHDRDRSAAEIIGGLRNAILRFASGVPQRDDLTAVVIKRVS
ncbi:PP2C family protein-serine/threonine phosphatase [Singulisphaera sp. Ch08]|uniref:PP2C family protein-serine/threonine phosphatase n=1 Tax=Singulisphaera sp. Ch08 TaxID=3120278 RepID=A0AAU7C6Z8_9BACT